MAATQIQPAIGARHVLFEYLAVRPIGISQTWGKSPLNDFDYWHRFLVDRLDWKSTAHNEPRPRVPGRDNGAAESEL